MRLDAHVAAQDGPFVVVFGESGADQSDHRIAVRAQEDADDVGAMAELPVQALLRLVRPDHSSSAVGEAGEGQHVTGGVGEELGSGGEPYGELLNARVCWAHTRSVNRFA